MTLMAVGGLTVPNDDTLIWRYMGFTKFVSLLSTGSLYLTRIDKFEDRIEGMLPDSTRPQYGDAMNKWFEENQKKLFASCWHQSPVESVLMWKSYSGGEPAVAIESTVGAVRQVLSSLPDAYVLGQVNYINFAKDSFQGVQPGAVNVVVQAYHKRQFFESEKEFRVVLNPFSDRALAAEKDGKTGITIPVELGSFSEPDSHCRAGYLVS